VFNNLKNLLGFILIKILLSLLIGVDLVVIQAGAYKIYYENKNILKIIINLIKKKSVLMVNPLDPLFQVIGQAYIKEVN
jgi:hypothetical protein